MSGGANGFRAIPNGKTDYYALQKWTDSNCSGSTDGSDLRGIKLL